MAPKVCGLLRIGIRKDRMELPLTLAPLHTVDRWVVNEVEEKARVAGYTAHVNASALAEGGMFGMKTMLPMSLMIVKTDVDYGKNRTEMAERIAPEDLEI